MARRRFELSPESIRKFRTERGLTRQVLGDALEGVSTQTIRNWETGTYTPPPYLRLALMYLVEKSLVTTIKEHKAKMALKKKQSKPKTETDYDPFA